MVLAAAQVGLQEYSKTEPPVLLWIETARDHLRSIALEWPQRLPELTTDVRNMEWLRDCPLSLATSRPCTDATAAWQTLTAFRTWLESRVLKQSVAHWLAAHRHPDALARWCKAQAMQLLPARCLAVSYPTAHALTPDTRCLGLLNEDTTRQTVQLRQLAQRLINEPDFVQQPTWQGQCAETGPWARLRHRPVQTLSQHSAWTRLSARWMELIEIAAADPQTASWGSVPLLASGALGLGHGQALSWCEMARGLLLHWVKLDAQDRVQEYRVLAPTEWNFHPNGALARALTALPFGDTVAAQVLAAAFDPCVACTVQN
jgi:hypothetical protein